MKETSQFTPCFTFVSAHKQAFESVVHFMHNEVICAKHCFLVREILDIYKKGYTAVGGDETDVQNYPAKCLIKKIEGLFKTDLEVATLDHCRGKFIFNSSLSYQNAKDELLDGLSNQ